MSVNPRTGSALSEGTHEPMAQEALMTTPNGAPLHGGPALGGESQAFDHRSGLKARRSSSRMRLCLLSAHFPPDLSGDGDYTYFLANALAGIGCDVQVIT